MAPSLSDEEIDDLIYLARVGEDADLTEMLQELAARDAATAADVLTTAREGQSKATCLHMAAANGHAKTVTLILSHLPVPAKASVAATPPPPASDEDGSTQAVAPAEPSLLLSRGASPAIANDKDQIPLDLAAFNNHMHVVDHFLAQSKDLEGDNAQGGGLASETQDLDVTEDASDDAAKNPESGG
ncbi:hypothetical protein NUW58_g3353 [Xylaria curta]|uniref:Uncharacterized protein n=1 Tax=Xylaria curta TaxID=42375 RepID=A0ACC1PBX5_9PEZI|nr:hypothetical protein NUW58_g3353 [Xylaria curta]